jgi:hypothetical protein
VRGDSERVSQERDRGAEDGVPHFECEAPQEVAELEPSSASRFEEAVSARAIGAGAELAVLDVPLVVLRSAGGRDWPVDRRKGRLLEFGERSQEVVLADANLHEDGRRRGRDHRIDVWRGHEGGGADCVDARKEVHDDPTGSPGRLDRLPVDAGRVARASRRREGEEPVLEGLGSRLGMASEAIAGFGGQQLGRREETGCRASRKSSDELPRDEPAAVDRFLDQRESQVRTERTYSSRTERSKRSRRLRVAASGEARDDETESATEASIQRAPPPASTTVLARERAVS